MKSIFKVAMLLTLSLLSLMIHAEQLSMAEQKDPYQLVQQVSERTFARFEADKALIAKDINHLKIIITEELLPYIDTKYASYKVLGRHLKSTSKQQRNEFVDAFTQYMVMTYAQAFTEYTDQKVEFQPTKPITSNIVSVAVNIVEPGRPDIKISFKVRKLKNETWRAFDMIAEGVSLIASKQSEIGALIEAQGIEQVSKTLLDKSATELKPKS
ncbi:phospholipid-binding protein MlaC [Paraferrimonas sp. SM1919]|uniref:MlaC/ttg2D family ABC transporter substrate-binding protein n=1 Tax=Paraferrimonas sp. SM1919 TaxID=2662263 RepID=UPI001F09B5CE|nr:ABC transporter substrate-binding protein [Paraferrimonas sp. SM1919]